MFCTAQPIKLNPTIPARPPSEAQVHRSLVRRRTSHPATDRTARQIAQPTRLRHHYTVFAQNKPILLDALTNVTSLTTVDYENKSNRKPCENKPNANPIRTRSKPIPLLAKMNPNFPPEKDYPNENAFGVQKNKPNQTQFRAPPLLSGRIKPIFFNFAYENSLTDGTELLNYAVSSDTTRVLL